VPISRTTDEWQAMIGAWLRDARLAREIDQESLARRAGISSKSLRNLEAGEGSTLGTLIKVTSALGRDDWLAALDEGSDQPSPLEMLREARRLPRKPQRAPRRSRG
jgi:transcriptional regulator with XRE-family HTH domain